nr:hypothetical protein CTI12_AA239000 [Tanacetum cinerariifolium]
IAGASNDINVLDNSPLFDDLLDDLAPAVPYVVNGVEYRNGYYLADGIYPEWASFVKSFTVATDLKHTLGHIYQIVVIRRGPMVSVLLLLFRDEDRYLGVGREGDRWWRLKWCRVKNYHFKELRCSAQCLTQLRIFKRYSILILWLGYMVLSDLPLHRSSSFDQFKVKSNREMILHSWHQESARKDVERAFGVLQGRWGLIQQPARAYEVNTLRRIMSMQIMSIDRCETQRRKAKEIRDRDSHISLQQNLMNHIWREVEEASEED